MKLSTKLIPSIVLAVCLLASCTAPAASPTASQSPVATSTSEPAKITSPQTLTILYTNDEHGWMEGEKPGQGAANLEGLWQKQEGYPDQGNFLVLSGGDNWTGPAISSWFQGQSMVEVMNTMGYTASAVGNHEFDFGLDALKERTSQASYTYLSANIRYKNNGQPPEDLGIYPYIIVDLNGLKVGILGLTATHTSYTANPAVVGVFNFGDYEAALRQTVPEVQAAGAQVIVVAAHICRTELESLARKVNDLNISLMGGGHCDELFADTAGNTVLLESGGYLSSYAYAHLSYDPASKAVTIVDYGTRGNEGGPENAAVAEVVSRWQEKASAEANVSIGYLKNEIPQKSAAMQALITESWLAAYPQADIALTNLGGMRDRLPAGDVTLGGLTSVMPFDNVLVEVKLTGKQLLQVLLANLTTPPAIGGMHKENGKWTLNKTGKSLDPNQTYSVLVNDFMYAGGDRYTMLAEFDPNAYNTGINWRQPVIDWVRAQNSSPQRPLDEAIAALIK